jgi:putative ABC transport system substrate-binding protein
MKRREFIALLSGVAAQPFHARAQQATLPVIGYLSSRSLKNSKDIVTAFHQGLSEKGYVEGRNVLIQYRFAAGHLDGLSSLASDLVQRNVNVIVATGGTSSVLAVKPITTSIPIVFAMGGDPVGLGVVESLARPTGNVTGVNFLVNGLAPKEIELLHELLPSASLIGFLGATNDPNLLPDIRELEEAAAALSKKLVVVKAGTDDELDSAFAALANQRVSALFVQVGPFFGDRFPKIADLAIRQALPTISGLKDFAVNGGLLSYGTSITDANRQLGVYTGLVLQGTAPANLPVVQSARFELVINLRTAKALRLAIPSTLLARADEIIE